jgi:hypothetical protein
VGDNAHLCVLEGGGRQRRRRGSNVRERPQRGEATSVDKGKVVVGRAADADGDWEWRRPQHMLGGGVGARSGGNSTHGEAVEMEGRV